MSYIKNLTVIYSSDANVSLPPPWKKISTDLNKGAGGLFIYLFKQLGDGAPLPGTAVRGITVLQGPNPHIPTNYTWDDTDLNKSVGGAFLYLAWTYFGNSKPILDVDVVCDPDHGAAVNKVPQGWHRINVDLNKGAGGHFIYLIYRDE